MSKPVSKNPFILSYKVLRNGIASFQNSTIQEIGGHLNKVGHCCLNVFATTALFIVMMLYAYEATYTPRFLYVLYAFAMWMQLATVRFRNIISLVLTVATELAIFGSVFVTSVNFFIHTTETLAVRDYAFPVVFFIVTVIRLVYMFILLKVLTFKNPHFTLSTTVFLKPTNTPVTFSSILAPQELDPTNPYYPQTVYNNNQPQINLLDKSLT